MRAGLFGGTFNPIHNGHLMVARQILDRFSLDRLYVIPCREPPHKMPTYLAPVSHRVWMIRLALPADDRLRLSEVEMRRRGPSYTIDTVNHFRDHMPAGTDLFLVMGMDAFLEIHTWKYWRQLLEAARPVVVTRWMDPGEADTDEIGRMDGYINARLSADYRFSEKHNCWRTTGGCHIHLLHAAPVMVSSSQVRRRIRDGKPVAALVPPAVNAYIDQKELYR
jgi:nicotinate-nucleotide adenylyltransferase